MAESKNILEIRDLDKNLFIQGQKLEVLARVNQDVTDGKLVAIGGASGGETGQLLTLQ